MQALTTHDLTILEKIKDPEAASAAPLLVDDSLPKDPHITQPVIYESVSRREREIVTSMQEIELRRTGLRVPSNNSLLSEYLDCIESLDRLIGEYPKYASARNNRAQALRRVYGDGILVTSEVQDFGEEAPLDTCVSEITLMAASSTILTDLSLAISLLKPPTLFAAISPQAARTLAQAYTQRGAIYHLTAKRLRVKGAQLRLEATRAEADWKTLEFEEHASNDFMIGGRYGNDIAKALAVTTNPTARLCGDMVREAMKNEYTGRI